MGAEGRKRACIFHAKSSSRSVGSSRAARALHADGSRRRRTVESTRVHLHWTSAYTGRKREKKGTTLLQTVSKSRCIREEKTLRASPRTVSTDATWVELLGATWPPVCAKTTRGLWNGAEKLFPEYTRQLFDDLLSNESLLPGGRGSSCWLISRILSRWDGWTEKGRLVYLDTDDARTDARMGEYRCDRDSWMVAGTESKWTKCRMFGILAVIGSMYVKNYWRHLISSIVNNRSEHDLLNSYHLRTDCRFQGFQVNLRSKRTPICKTLSADVQSFQSWLE